MTRRLRRFTGPTARADAIRAVRALGRSSLYPRPLPYCTHPRWTPEGSAGRFRGRHQPCLCTAVDEPNRRCIWVTWQHAAVHRDGADYLVQEHPGEAAVLDELVDGQRLGDLMPVTLEDPPRDEHGEPVDLAEEWREEDEPGRGRP